MMNKAKREKRKRGDDEQEDASKKASPKRAPRKAKKSIPSKAR